MDFAYAIHSEVGDRTVGAKVNGRLVPLHTVLPTGATVEIMTTKNEDAGPSEDWLKFVRSSRARTKIRQYFAKGTPSGGAARWPRDAHQEHAQQ